MKTHIIHISLLIFAILGGSLQAQSPASVNDCHCCDPRIPFIHGEQIDCPGGLPFVEFEDTLYMAIANVTVELSPTYYPTGGTASWSNGASSLTTAVSPGSVSVTYTTALNCSHTDTIEVVGNSNHISGNFFLDLDGDGFKAPSETTSISGLRISLYNTAGDLIRDNVTDASGNYSFEGLKPQDYVLRVDSPMAGTVVSPPGIDNAFEQTSRATAPITLTPTSNITNIHGGLWPVTPGGISGQLWVDLDGDGIRSPGEPPIPGVPVFIFDVNGGAPDIFITDANGGYDYRYLPPGGYFVQVFPPEEFPIVTIPFQGPGNTDSDFFPIPGNLLTPPSAQTLNPIQINPPGQQVPNIDLGLKKDTVVRVKVIGIISGADRGNGEMGNELATGGMLPATEPYSGLGYGLTEGAGLVLNLSKVPDVVDYVVVELRDKNDSSVVVASKPGYMRKDGSVVDECGKTLTFSVPSGSYYVVLRHRNHLDIRTKFPLFLDDQDQTVDFTDPNQPTAGLEPEKTLDDGRLGLWGGDASGDNELKYSGPDNDRQKILIDIGGTDITNSTSGYKLEDINLDGIIKYSGPDNDRQPLLENLGGTDITNTRKSGDKQ